MINIKKKDWPQKLVPAQHHKTAGAKVRSYHEKLSNHLQKQPADVFRLKCGRKVEYLEITHTNKRRTCKHHTV